MRSRRDPHHRQSPEQSHDALDTLLAQAAEAFESGRPKVALALAEEALKQDEECAQAYHVKAVALVDLDRADEAHEAYDEARAEAREEGEGRRAAVRVRAAAGDRLQPARRWRPRDQVAGRRAPAQPG